MNIAAPNRAKRPRGADRRSIADSASLADAVVPTGVFGPLGILFERRTRRGLFATFLISLLVYGLTCARTLTGEDCGEFVSAAYTFGVAHPPGYPLWTMLAKLFTVLVPFGEIAFRVAFMSAFFGALTTTALAASSLLLVRSWPAALAAAFGFAFLRDQWSQATIVEVYTLNSSFLSTCVLLLLAWSKIKSPRLLTAFAFTFGLSLTNHQTMLALAPGAFFFILFHHRRFLLEGRLLLSCVGAAVLGLLPYAYLPIAARRHPASNWGDPSDWTRFVDHVLRRQYTGGGDPPPKET